MTAPDTLRRIDMKFICDKDTGGRGSAAMLLPCATVKSYEISQDYLNYYLPHCGPGITDVRGYARVVYENVFPEIDVHLYSNAYGPKMFFVVKPSGNPASIRLQFEGQNSITAITSTLAMYLGAWEMSFPNAYAYEINNTSNAATVLSWQPAWNHSGGGNVTIFTGSYNSANTLVIAVGGSGGTPLAQENLDWSVYYGAAGEQKDGKIDADSRSVYHGMTQYAISFPASKGQQQPGSAGIAYMGDWCISRFTNTVRNWCTYYGGSSVDQLTALKVYKGVDGEISRMGDLWAAGMTTSDNVVDATVPASFFKQGYDAGGANTNTYRGDGLIAAFDKTSGYLKYNTYFGSEKTESIQDLAIDHDKGDVYIVGAFLFLPGFSLPTFNNSCAAQASGRFPLCSGNAYYFKNVLNTDGNDGFIAQLSIKGGIQLKWSTLFGGDKEDEITYAEVHKGKLYIGGITQSQNMDQYPSPALTHSLNKFPLANYPGSFFQNKCNSVSAFISCFDEDKRLVWSTLLGTALGVRGIDVNSKGDLYVLLSQVVEGHYEPSSAAANASGKVPTFNNGLGYYETSVWNRAGAALLKFDPSFRLSWATKLHAYPAGAYYFFQPQQRNSGLVIDEADRVFVYTSLDPMANPTFTVQLNGAYWQSINAASATGSYDEGKTDNFIYAFNSSDQLQWATFFGGLGSTGALTRGRGSSARATLSTLPG